MRATPAVYRGSGLCCCHVFMQFMLVSCQAVHSTTPVRCLENELPAQSLPAHRCSRLQTPSALPWHGDARCRRRALPRPRVPNLRECRLETKTSTCDKQCARLRLEPRVLGSTTLEFGGWSIHVVLGLAQSQVTLGQPRNVSINSETRTAHRPPHWTSC